MANRRKQNETDSTCDREDRKDSRSTNNRSKRGNGGNRKPKEDKKDDAPKKTNSNIPAVIQSGGHSNPPEDGFEDAMLLNQTMNLGFQTILGDTYMDVGYREPTIARMRMAPSPGSSFYQNEAGQNTQERDGLNLAITDFYTTLSAFSGRATSYAPQDVGTLILAMGSVIEQIEHWRRTIAVARVYNERNDAMPLRLLQALQIGNPVSFCANINLYIDYLNTIITSFNTLPIPENIKFLTRCRDLFQGVYWDDPVLTAQIEVQVPYYYWEVDETSYTGGTILKTGVIPVLNAPSDLSYLMNLVDLLLNSSTYQIIRSDILNVASKLGTPMWKLDIVDLTYKVGPVYDPSFQLKWHNATMLGEPTYGAYDDTSVANFVFTPSNDVYPDPNTNMLLYGPAFKLASSLEALNNPLIDMPIENPTPIDVYEATRFLVACNSIYQDSSSNIWAYNAVLPDHYPIALDIYSGTITNTARANIGKTVNIWDSSLPATAISATDTSSVLTQFNYHPRWIILDAGASYKPAEYWDVDFFTHVDWHKLRRMYRLTYQGLFKFRIK